MMNWKGYGRKCRDVSLLQHLPEETEENEDNSPSCWSVSWWLEPGTSPPRNIEP